MGWGAVHGCEGQGAAGWHAGACTRLRSRAGSALPALTPCPACLPLPCLPAPASAVRWKASWENLRAPPPPPPPAARPRARASAPVAPPRALPRARAAPARPTACTPVGGPRCWLLGCLRAPWECAACADLARCSLSARLNPTSSPLPPHPSRPMQASPLLTSTARAGTWERRLTRWVPRDDASGCSGCGTRAGAGQGALPPHPAPLASTSLSKLGPRGCGVHPQRGRAHRPALGPVHSVALSAVDPTASRASLGREEVGAVRAGKPSVQLQGTLGGQGSEPGGEPRLLPPPRLLRLALPPSRSPRCPGFQRKTVHHRAHSPAACGFSHPTLAAGPSPLLPLKTDGAV